MLHMQCQQKLHHAAHLLTCNSQRNPSTSCSAIRAYVAAFHGINRQLASSMQAPVHYAEARRLDACSTLMGDINQDGMRMTGRPRHGNEEPKWPYAGSY
jgi:hypothetical protein